MIRQFFDCSTCAFTYILHSEGQAVIIDPVLDNVPKYQKLLEELGIRLLATFETHVHADHITGAFKLKSIFSSEIIVPLGSSVQRADCYIKNLERFGVGAYMLTALHTPGHTDDSTCYIVNRSAIFTGDTLLVRKCGRIDFQNGNPAHLWESIKHLYANLPDSCIVYPGHDYEGFNCSTIGEEKQFNKRMTGQTSIDAFCKTMDSLNLKRPKNMDINISRNLNCGRAEGEASNAG